MVRAGKANAKLNGNVGRAVTSYTVLGTFGIWLFLGTSAALIAAAIPGYNTAVGFTACGLTVLLAIVQHGQLYKLSRLTFGWIDGLTALAGGYGAANINWMLTWIFYPRFRESFAIAESGSLLIIALLGPIVEEIVFRGVILSSLSERMPSLWAVLVTAAAASAYHESFASSVAGQVGIGIIYLSSRRSLTAAIIAHIVINLLAFKPSFYLVSHFVPR